MPKTETAVKVDEPLIDTTAAIPLHSKRTERKQKLRQKKEKARSERMAILDLPTEIIIEISGHLRPSDIFILSRVNKPLRQFVLDRETNIASEIIKSRYLALSKCFQLPVLLEKVEKGIHPDLQSEERQELLNIHKKPYQHIQAPDPSVICTCLTCMLAWNNLCVIVDFSRWQNDLETVPITPIPLIPRGKFPKWNQKLIVENAAIVEKALRSPLWYGRILEQHLKTTTRAIFRHASNRGNQRRRFRMTEEDAASETDLFLEQSGPPSMDFPYMRDNYYMLEAYLPNRGWNAEKSRWMYATSQHDRDIEFVMQWAKRRYAVAQAAHKSPLAKVSEDEIAVGNSGVENLDTAVTSLSLVL